MNGLVVRSSVSHETIAAPSTFLLSFPDFSVNLGHDACRVQVLTQFFVLFWIVMTPLQFPRKSNGVVGAFPEEEFGILAFLSQLGVKGDGSIFILLDSIVGIGDHSFFPRALGLEYVLRTWVTVVTIGVFSRQ